jgi:hypothetical protein
LTTRKLLLAVVFITVFASLAPAQVPWSYSTYLGGIGNESVRSTLVDTNGNIFVGGTTASNGRPFTGSLEGFRSPPVVYLAKYNINGQLLFLKTWAGTASLAGMYADLDNNIYMAGRAAAGFQTTGSALQTQGGTFILKLANDGSTLFAARFGTGGTFATAINSDSAGDILLCG